MMLSFHIANDKCLTEFRGNYLVSIEFLEYLQSLDESFCQVEMAVYNMNQGNDSFETFVLFLCHFTHDFVLFDYHLTAMSNDVSLSNLKKTDSQ